MTGTITTPYFHSNSPCQRISENVFYSCTLRRTKHAAKRVQFVSLMPPSVPHT